MRRCLDTSIIIWEYDWMPRVSPPFALDKIVKINPRTPWETLEFTRIPRQGQTYPTHRLILTAKREVTYESHNFLAQWLWGWGHGNLRMPPPNCHPPSSSKPFLDGLPKTLHWTICKKKVRGTWYTYVTLGLFMNSQFDTMRLGVLVDPGWWEIQGQSGKYLQLMASTGGCSSTDGWYTKFKTRTFIKIMNSSV